MEDEIKLSVIGRSGVGKSCLIRQFIQSMYLDSYDPTIEDIYWKQFRVDNLLCSVNILLMPSSYMRERYLGESDGFLLLFSLVDRASLEAIFTHHKDILKAKETDSCPIILVGTKSDLVDEREVTEDEARNMARDLKIPYIEVSAKMNVNVNECFSEIVRSVRICPENRLKRRVRAKKGDCQIA